MKMPCSVTFQIYINQGINVPNAYVQGYKINNNTKYK